MLDFEEAHRAWMRQILSAGTITPRLRTDNYRVEANWLQSPGADILALSNWTGCEQTVNLELDNAPAYREISSVTGKLLSKETQGNTLRLRVVVAAGDLIRLQR